MPPKWQQQSGGKGAGTQNGGQQQVGGKQKGGTQKQPPQQAKPKPPAKKKFCHRCYRNMVPDTDPHDHNLSACTKAERYRTGDKLNSLWPKYASPGPPADLTFIKKDDYDTASDLLLEGVPNNATEFKGKPITKRMLECAFQVLFDDAGRNRAEGNRQNKSNPAGNKSQGSGPTHTPAPAPATNQPRAVPPLKLYDAPRMPKPMYPETVKANVLSPIDHAVDTSLCLEAKAGQELITTNHIAVSDVPSTIYVYYIDYGETNAVSKKKEEAKKQAADLLSKTANMSMEDQGAADSDAAEGSGAGHDAIPSKPSDGPESEGGGGKKIAQRSEKARIFKALDEGPELKKIHWATDYTLLWTLEELPPTVLTILEIEYTKLSGRKYTLDRIDFEYKRELTLGPGAFKATQQLITREGGEYTVTDKGASMRITALNALVSKYVSIDNLNVIPVGPNKFFLKNGWSPIDRTLNIHRGYFTSIRPGNKTVLLNVNVATSAFYNPILVAEYYGLVRDDAEAQSTLKGLTVRIRYQRVKHDDDYDPNLEANRYRVIAGFGGIPSQQTFDLQGENVTVAEYFRRRGYAHIKYPDVPCISVNIASPDGKAGKKKDDKKHDKKLDKKDDKTKAKAKPQWILPELLHIDVCQLFKKLLPPEYTEAMIEQAVRRPAETQKLIVSEGFAALGLTKHPSPFNKSGLTLGDRLLQVPARKLTAPKIVYNSHREAKVSNAGWNLANVKFYSLPSRPIAKAVCTIDMRTGNKRGLTGLGAQLTGHIAGHGIKFALGGKEMEEFVQETHEYIDVSDCITDDKKLRETLSQKLSECGSPELAVVLLSSKQAEPYGAIKRACDQWLALHTICFVEASAYAKANFNQTLSNLSLKFNMKLLGQNHAVCDSDKRPARPGGRPEHVSAFEAIKNDTVVFGADVSHAGSSMPSTPSVAAVVASDDSSFANFPASMRLQPSTQEAIQQLRDMVYYRLMHYAKKHSRLPRKILFYRDGVSEDQFAMCKKDEMKQIEDAYQDAMKHSTQYKGKSVKDCLQLTFVVVGKRHHTRFFPQTDEQTISPTNGNVKPGFIVDDIVTRPNIGDGITDFFLQSHAAIKGTARSGHYNVLQLEGLGLDQLQKLTHAFCYNYMRATKGVSYVGPAYYADRLCERGTHYLRGYVKAKVGQYDIPESDKRKDPEYMKKFAQQVVNTVSGAEEWRPTLEAVQRTEPNPWHPSFNDRMFWL